MALFRGKSYRIKWRSHRRLRRRAGLPFPHNKSDEGDIHDPSSARSRGDLEAIETASRDEISALQLERLKWSVRHTYDNVSPTASAAREGRAPGRPEDAVRPGQVPLHDQDRPARQLPLRPVRGAAPESGARARLQWHHRQIDGGGLHQQDLDNWADLVARSLRAAGVRPGDMVQNSYGYGMFTGGLGAHFGIERLGCTVVPMSGGQTEKQVQQIMDFKPDAIMVTPSYSLVIAEEFERLGIKPDEISLQVGIFGAEPWGEGMRAEIETQAGH